MARGRADEDEDDVDDAPLDDEESVEDDSPAEDDDVAPEAADDDIDDDAPLNIFESDDDAAEVGVTEEDYEEDDGKRPFYRHPILLAAVGLVLLIGVAIAWTWVAFDQEAYDAQLAPPTVVAALPPAPRPAAPPPAEVAEAPAVAAPDAVAEAPAAAPPIAVPQPQVAAAPPPAAPTPAAPAPAAAVAPPAAAAPAAAPTPAPPAPAPEALAALAPAPDPGLVEPGANGPLPVVGADGRQPWRVYARPFAAPPETPKIGIVIGGLGLSRAATQAAIQQLPPEVTLAFAPYAPNLEAQIAEARAAGHEVILQLPMEPERYPANDPGPHTLLTTATAEDNLARLHWLLSRFSGYVGVTNYLGAKLSTSAEALRPILSDLSKRGLMFVDARDTPQSVAGDVAAELAMPRVVNNTFLDREASRAGVDARLLELERTVARGGSAVGFGYAYPVTIERVGAWARTLRDKNVTLAPISAMARTSPTQ